MDRSRSPQEPPCIRRHQGIPRIARPSRNRSGPDRRAPTSARSDPGPHANVSDAPLSRDPTSESSPSPPSRTSEPPSAEAQHEPGRPSMKSLPGPPCSTSLPSPPSNVIVALTAVDHVVAGLSVEECSPPPRPSILSLSGRSLASFARDPRRETSRTPAPRSTWLFPGPPLTGRYSDALI